MAIEYAKSHNSIHARSNTGSPKTLSKKMYYVPGQPAALASPTQQWHPWPGHFRWWPSGSQSGYNEESTAFKVMKARIQKLLLSFVNYGTWSYFSDIKVFLRYKGISPLWASFFSLDEFGSLCPLFISSWGLNDITHLTQFLARARWWLHVRSQILFSLISPSVIHSVLTMYPVQGPEAEKWARQLLS